MRHILFVLSLFIVSTSVWAEGPVEKVECGPADDSSGYHLEFKLSKDYEYGSLTIKRSGDGKKEASYMKDLSSFKGGKYTLDVVAKGGVTGYALENKEKGSSYLKRTEAIIDCGKLPMAASPAPSMIENKNTGVIFSPSNSKPAPVKPKTSVPARDTSDIKDF